MYAQVEKPKENKSRAVANSVVQNKSSGKQGFGFLDNRPEAKTQNVLQLMMNDQRNVKNPKVMQRMAVMAVDNMNDQTDSLVWNNMQYAAQQAGGPIGDMRDNKVWNQLDDMDNIRIVEHGEEKKVGGKNANEIALSMTTGANKLPNNKAIGEITFQSCYAGVDGGQGSLVSDMALELKSRGLSGIPIKGRTGIAFGFEGLGEETATTTKNSYSWNDPKAERRYRKTIGEKEHGLEAYCEVMWELRQEKTKISNQYIFESPFAFCGYRKPWKLIKVKKTIWDMLDASTRSVRVSSEMEDYWDKVKTRMQQYGGFKPNDEALIMSYT